MIDLQKILNYLTDLDQNNNRDWYHEHKNERLEAFSEFETLIKELMIRLGRYDPEILSHEPKELTFKLNRDTRFSKDKSPYNPAFRAHISSKGKLPVPVGYFLFIMPQNRSFLGGGLFADMFTEATTMIRDYLCVHGQEFSNIINNKEFSHDFTVMGTKLKNVPRGYDKDNSMAEYLKHKSWFLEYPVKDDILLSSDAFIETAVEKFKLMMPFNNYLNSALKDFKMPER